jgi:hypothetical protein
MQNPGRRSGWDCGEEDAAHCDLKSSGPAYRFTDLSPWGCTASPLVRMDPSPAFAGAGVNSPETCEEGRYSRGDSRPSGIRS